MKDGSSSHAGDERAGDYRSELASAKERIRKLEEELAARGGPRRKPPSPLRLVLLGVGLASIGLAVMGFLAYRGLGTVGGKHGVPPVPTQLEHVQAPPSLDGAQWYTPTRAQGRPPILLDVNGDGIKDVVGLAWDARDDEHALAAVAFDGTTYAMLWHSEGISSQWASPKTSMRLQDGMLVVSDSRNELRVIDPKSGIVKEKTLASPLDAGDPVPPPTAEAEELLRATPRARGAGFHASEAHASGEVVASFGWLATDGGAEDFLVGWNRRTKEIVYEVPQRAPNDVPALHNGYEQRTVDELRVYTAFVAADTRGVRLLSRSLRTGEVAWTQNLPGTDEGAQLRSLDSIDGRVFCAVDGALFVFDAASGKSLMRLSGF